MPKTERTLTVDDTSICIILPTYNNAGTLLNVVERIRLFDWFLIIVDDGSTDNTYSLLQENVRDRVKVIHYDRNRGKGYALKRGFREALRKGFAYALTIDADGQHFPEDMPLLVQTLRQNPQSIITGTRNLQSKNMPDGNTFANKFSNFWFRLQTGTSLSDTQCGFRIYPLDRLPKLGLITNRYEAELELLVLSSWRGIAINEVPVRVYYPPKGERISHFHPVFDFMRISLLNTLLCIGAITYGAFLRTIRFCKRSVYDKIHIIVI